MTSTEWDAAWIAYRMMMFNRQVVRWALGFGV
jgi:hypothetical protein